MKRQNGYSQEYILMYTWYSTVGQRLLSKKKGTETKLHGGDKILLKAEIQQYRMNMFFQKFTY